MATQPPGPLFEQHPTDFLDELARDLDAAWDPSRRPDDPREWLTRPAVLRRVAHVLAERLDERTTRIVGAGQGADALATAVSLATGVPCALSDREGRIGEALPPGELLAVISAGPVTQALVDDFSRTTGALVHQHLAVLADDGAFTEQSGVITPAGGIE